MEPGTSDHNGQEPERKRPAKLFHKKSRTGCQQCRIRRVKCNEAKPICSNCHRLDLTCIYDRHVEDKLPSCKSKTRAKRAIVDDKGDPPESEQRRKLELQLYYHFVFETGPSLAVDEFSRKHWLSPLPGLALQSDGLLYAMYCITAVHKAHTDPDNKEEHLNVCHTYLSMTLREHAKEVAHLSKENVDLLVLTSALLRLYHTYMLKLRPLVPYKPPTEWLMATGTGSAIFRQAWPLIEDNPDCIARIMVGHIPIILDDEARTGPDNREGLLHLLRRQEPHELAEPWDAGVQEAYETTLSYIGGVWKAMNNGEPPMAISKRLIIFSMMVDKRFVGLVDEQRPRALVILAHYFALFSMLHERWWIGDTGEREVNAIARVLPDEWKGMMGWPLQILEEQIIFTKDTPMSLSSF